MRAKLVLLLAVVLCAGASVTARHLLAVSTDGTCGVNNKGNTCPSGSCCSQFGYCGSTTAYCSGGCQTAYGTCTSTASTPTPAATPSASTTPSSTPAATPVTTSAPTSAANLATSTNGVCGAATQTKCPSSYSCSQFGYCGTTTAYTFNCQAGYGGAGSPSPCAAGSAVAPVATTAATPAATSTTAATATPTATPASTATHAATVAATTTPTPTATSAATHAATVAATTTPTPTATSAVTHAATVAATTTPTPTATSAATHAATVAATPTPTPTTTTAAAAPGQAGSYLPAATAAPTSAATAAATTTPTPTATSAATHAATPTPTPTATPATTTAAAAPAPAATSKPAATKTPVATSTPNATAAPVSTNTPAPSPVTIVTTGALCSETYPSVPFGYVDSAGAKTVALTFDDGPDGDGHTDAVLDALKAAGVKATFFVNANNYCDVTTDPCKTTLARIPAEGHTVGDHTYDHPHLDTLTNAQIATEFSSVDADVGAAMTLYRMPYGEPFQDPSTPMCGPGNTPCGAAEIARVASVTTKFGVHVGWTFDGEDYNCADDAACVTTAYTPFYTSGSTGVVLHHSVYGGTASALPAELALAKSKGYTFVTPDYYVQQIYGMSSGAVTAAFAACPAASSANSTATAGR